MIVKNKISHLHDFHTEQQKSFSQARICDTMKGTLKNVFLLYCER